MVMSAAKAHWKPNEVGGGGKMVDCRTCCSAFTPFKRAKRIWFVFDKPGIS